jgi:hypothetical protein
MIWDIGFLLLRRIYQHRGAAAPICDDLASAFDEDVGCDEACSTGDEIVSLRVAHMALLAGASGARGAG